MTPLLLSTMIDAERKLVFSTRLPLWLVATILGGTALFVTFLYVRDLRTKRTPGRWALMVLRLLLVLCMAYILLEPTLVDTRRYREESTVVVLIDSSQSSKLADVLRRTELRLSIARLAGLLNTEQLEQLDKGASFEAIVTPKQEAQIDKVTRIEQIKYLLGSENGLIEAFRNEGLEIDLLTFSSAVSAVKIEAGRSIEDLNLVDTGETGRATDLSLALSMVRKLEQKKRIAGIVLLSDGDANIGRDPIEEARLISSKDIPVYPVGLGNPDEPCDIVLETVKCKKAVYVNDTVIVKADLASSGYEKKEVRVALRAGDETLAEETVTLHAQPGKAQVDLKFEPKQTGLMQCIVEVAPLDDEVRVDNNGKRFEVEVIKEKRRVLLVEQYPRWEWRFIKNAVGRDPDFDLTMVLFHSNERPARGEQYLPDYPKRERDLYEYDIIMFGDVASDEFSARQLEMTRDFVEKMGRPLVMISGPNHAPYGFEGTPIEDLLPVVLRSGDSRAAKGIYDERGFSLEMTAAGWKHPILTLADGDENDRVWAEMPPSYWCADVERAKAGATALAVHPREQNQYGKLPLVVIQRYGAGKVLMLNIDSSWRWRYEHGDVYHYRFWGNILRWLIAAPLEGESKYVRISTDKEAYRQSEVVTVTARVQDAEFAPYTGGSVFVEVTDPFAGVERVQLELRDPGLGLYEGRFTVGTGGSWRLRSIVSDLGADWSQSELKIEVASEELEARSLRMRRDVLADMANITGGRFHMLDTASDIPGEIRKLNAENTTKTGHELWDTFIVILIFSAFITGEWLLRKRKGYV
ncbi:MAG: hypothetical protein JW889_04435 [Verrucomicrobia bacterium]|nr:hypothetical protein [Verrucomicrobiota bacterium]